MASPPRMGQDCHRSDFTAKDKRWHELLKQRENSCSGQGRSPTRPSPAKPAHHLPTGPGLEREKPRTMEAVPSHVIFQDDIHDHMSYFFLVTRRLDLTACRVACGKDTGGTGSALPVHDNTAGAQNTQAPCGHEGPAWRPTGKTWQRRAPSLRHVGAGVTVPRAGGPQARVTLGWHVLSWRVAPWAFFTFLKTFL